MEDQITNGITIVQENLPFYMEIGMRLLSAALILIAGWMIGNWLSKRIENIKKMDSTLTSFLGGFIKYAVFAISVVTVLGQFGIQTASLLAVLGAAGLAIGLALQGTLSNVASGTMLLILRPFNVGDYITFGSTSGTVKTLGLFGTELATTDNVYIFAPNSHIWGNDIMNYSRNKERRNDIIVGISYDDDIDKASKTMMKIMSKEERILTKKDKEPKIIVGSMGAFSVDLTVRVWTKKEDFAAVKSDLTKALKEGLEKDGITIPFPTSVVKMEGEKAAKAKKAA